MGRLQGWMRAAVLGQVTAILLTTAAAAQDTEIQDTIGGQLQAFTERDIGGAFGFASPTIQGLFGTPENFGTMVRNGYPMVWSHDEVRFLELREIAGVLYQKVMIRDAQGVLHILDYKMIETDRGWLIDGVSFLPGPDVGA